jgi:hypothetical protein
MIAARLCALVALLVAQTAPPSPRVSSPHEAESSFSERVDQEALRRYVRELVAFGPRMGGTPSNERAAAHVGGFFRALGLETQTLTDPPLMAHWERSWSLQVEGGDEPIASAYPYGFSPSASGSAELLVVADLERARPDAAWAGKAIFTHSDPASAYTRLGAPSHRPAVIITNAPNDSRRYIDWTRIGSLPASAGNRLPVFGISYRDGERLAAMAGRRVSYRLDATIERRQPLTVLAMLPGVDRERAYLVCAHGDSDAGGPGADDNASGVATVLELARVLSTMVKDGALPRPAVSIRFAVWGAEYHSARAFVARAGRSLDRTLGVINFDETGIGAEREAIYFESNDVPWNERLLRTLEDVGEDYVGRPGFWPEFTTNPSQGGTDSYVFLPRAYQGEGLTTLRIPSTTVFTAAWDKTATLKQTPGWTSAGVTDGESVVIDYSPYYHSSGDLPENTTEREPQNMVRAVKAVGLALLRLAWGR